MEGYLTAMTTVVNGAACILPPVMDFITSRQVPLLRLPERFMKFWREVDREIASLGPTPFVQCWAKEDIP